MSKVEAITSPTGQPQHKALHICPKRATAATRSPFLHLVRSLVWVFHMRWHQEHVSRGTAVGSSL